MRYELSDGEWAAIRPMLPNKARGVPRVDDQRVLNGIFLRAAVRCAVARSTFRHHALAAEPYARGFFADLANPRSDLFRGDRADRMIDHDRLEIRHAERLPGQFGLAHELGRDDGG